MKHREYCSLSMTVSQYVLDRILSCGATEVVVERIHKYLTAMGDDIWCGKIELGEFIIHKRLGNPPPPPSPEDYSMPKDSCIYHLRSR